jgi:hypothetical protein
MEKLKFHPTFGNKLYFKLINNCPELQNVSTGSESQKYINTNVNNNNNYLIQQPNINVNNVNNTKRISNKL